MRAFRFAVLAFPLLLFGQQAPAPEQTDSCLECHQELEDELGKPAQLFDVDIHKQFGFSCVDCHGGDPTSYDPDVSMSPARGFRGKISPQEIPASCGGCHSDPNLIHKFKPQQRVDQLVQYRTSVHGKRLAQGDTKVAECVDCHSVHDIREVRHALSPVHPTRLPQTCGSCHADAEYMEEYSISTDQLAEYHRSVHWKALDEQGDLSAPTCATCHGNHGATPPGVGSVAQVCGTCHVVFQRAFDQSPHKDAFEAMELAACIACHENHEIVHPVPQMLGVGEASTCTQCHVEGERAYEVAATMKERIDGLRAALADAEEILDRAEASGMEVSDGWLDWNSAHEQLVMARVQVHRFSMEPVTEAVDEGLKLAVAGHEAGEEALEERDFRRKGLALSLVTILITIAGLWLALRSLESRKAQPGQDQVG